MEDRSINVLAYNLVTVLAEKLETIISRGDQNTRPRDYYDVYILTVLQNEKIDLNSLKEALEQTTRKRGSTEIVKQYKSVIQIVRESDVMQKQWNNYASKFDYTSGLNFSDTCDAVMNIMEQLSRTN